MRNSDLFGSIILAGIVLFALCPLAANPASPPLAAGDLSADFVQGHGLVLTYRGVPIIEQNTLYVVTPGWGRVLFSQQDTDAVKSATTLPDGNAQMTATLAGDSARVVYTITLSPANTATIDMAITPKRDTPMQMEYCAGYVSADLLAGASFTADSGAGVVPVTAASADENASMLSTAFRNLSFRTRIGRLDFAAAGDWPTMKIFDARLNPQDWAREAPIFWMGLGVPAPDLPYEGGKTYHETMQVSVTPMPTRPPAPTVITDGAVSTTPDAQGPQIDPPVIIPTPKSYRLLGGQLPLSSRTKIVVPGGASVSDRQTAEEFQDAVRQRCGVSLPMVAEDELPAGRSVSGMLVFGSPPYSPLVRRLLASQGATRPSKEEGYALRVTPRFAVVAGHDAAGTFYGEESVAQLIGAGSSGPFLFAAAVDDYPTLAFRGAHLFVGDHALPFHEKLIRDILARYKMNALVLQCEQAKWPALGNLAPSWGMPMKDLAAEVAYARRYHMQPIPLIESVGHMEWYLNNSEDRELAEDPERPYAIRPADPAANARLLAIYDEAIQLFHPAYFHIGGDEVTMDGRYPDASAAKYPTVADAFDAQVEYVAGYLAARGIRPMMWGDMLLPRGSTQDATNAPSAAQAAQMQAALPKTITITDWHYAAAGDFSSPKMLEKAGFPVIAATWSDPENIVHFTDAECAAGGVGLLQTTWDGFDSSEDNLKANPKDFIAFVLAAEYAWSGVTTPPDSLPFRAAQVFNSDWNPKPMDMRTYPGFLADLTGAEDLPLGGSRAWLGYGPSFAPPFPTGRRRLAGVLYQIDPQAVALAGALLPDTVNAPRKAQVNLSGNLVKRLSLLTATAFAAADGETIGELDITYASGRSSDVPLVYGSNIEAWNDSADIPQAPTVWSGRTQAGLPAVLRALTWTNPNPSEPIRSVSLTTSDPQASPVLFALTGIGPTPSRPPEGGQATPP